MTLLFQEADSVRRRFVGDEVHLRGLVEIGNRCIRDCIYCGLRGPNKLANRYRMKAVEIIECAQKAYDLGYGTVVLQSGEHPEIAAGWLGEIIREIKRNYPVAVALSMGERSEKDYAYWRLCGADRYLLKFETSDPRLLLRIQTPLPDGRSRLDRLRVLKKLGYEIGAGMMVGLPGQRASSLAEDLLWLTRLDADMIAIGPYIPHGDTPMGKNALADLRFMERSELKTLPMTMKALALARLLCPTANIPATTALATLEDDGYSAGLAAGANVIMPNITPMSYRKKYEIYPDSAACREEDTHSTATAAIEAAGRTAGRGWGSRRRADFVFNSPFNGVQKDEFHKSI